MGDGVDFVMAVPPRDGGHHGAARPEFHPVGASSPATRIATGNAFEARAASIPGPGTTPVDGRLRGPDFAATVTQVAWPDRATYAGQSEEPPTGHRFIVFALHLAENSAVVDASSSDPER
jgi:hypothetical protein